MGPRLRWASECSRPATAAAASTAVMVAASAPAAAARVGAGTGADDDARPVKTGHVGFQACVRSAEQREDPIGKRLTVEHRYGITFVSNLTPSDYMPRKSSFDLSRGVQGFTSILVCSEGWSSGPTVHVAAVFFTNRLKDEVD